MLGLAILLSGRLLRVGIERNARDTGEGRYQLLGHARIRWLSYPGRLARNLLIRIAWLPGTGLAYNTCVAGGEVPARLRLPAFAWTPGRYT